MSNGYFIGLMSGTSLDGVDAALINCANDQCNCVETFFLPYPKDFKKQILSLHLPQENELELSLVTANEVSNLYATAVSKLLEQAQLTASDIIAIGAHGQTIRHRPELGFSCQLLNSAMLAELTQINVVSDFRSRDIAAGGQGAPLVPSFHQAIFSHPTINRAIVNIGGISNVTYLPTDDKILGFDTGPGNILLDHWIQLKLDLPYDKGGQWAKSGQCLDSILNSMLSDPFFTLMPPKSTGRDLFNAGWLQQHILYPHCKPEDIANTLVEFTVSSILQQMHQFCDAVEEIYLCGGGARNTFLVERLNAMSTASIKTTDNLGIHSDWVEAIAFAWLAKQYFNRASGNAPTVTGAAGPRILGTMSVA